MAPRPKTYGARRSRAKLAGGLVNGITSDESANILKKIDIMSMGTRNHTRKNLVIAPKGEKQEDVVRQILRTEDQSAFGERGREHATPLRTPNHEDKSTTSGTRSQQRKRKMSARDILHPDTSLREPGQYHESIRFPINGSAIPKTQDCFTETALQPVLLECTPPSHPRTSFPPNGFTADHQQSPLGPDIGLRDMPINLNEFATWVARLISVEHQNKSHSSAMPEPRQKESSPQPGQGIEKIDASENVDVRMTRGRERRRLQELKGKASINGTSLSLLFLLVLCWDSIVPNFKWMLQLIS